MLLLAVGCGSNDNRPNEIDANDGVLRCPNRDVAVASNTVAVQDFRFVPACVVIPAGSTVTWTNAGMINQSVTSEPGGPVSFDSGSLGLRGTFSFTFPAPGVFTYRSTPYQVLGMQGQVMVQ